MNDQGESVLGFTPENKDGDRPGPQCNEARTWLCLLHEDGTITPANQDISPDRFLRSKPVIVRDVSAECEWEEIHVISLSKGESRSSYRIQKRKYPVIETLPGNRSARRKRQTKR